MTADAQTRGNEEARRSLSRPVLAVIVCYLAIQIGLPAVILVQNRTSLLESRPLTEQKAPARLGWQMFAESTLRRTYYATRADGTTFWIDPTKQLGGLQGRALYSAATRHAVCAAHPDVVSLHWDEQDFPCR